MSWKQLAGKGTWLGTATAAVVLLAALGVSSLLLLRGIVPERAMGIRLCIWCNVDRGADGKRGDTFCRQRHRPDLRRVGRRPFGGTDRHEAEAAEAPQRPPEGR